MTEISSTSAGRYHVEFLREELLRRKQRNPRYSLRAFAQFLDLDPAALCRILAGKQELSLKATQKSVLALRLVGDERERFVVSVADSLRERAGDFLHAPSGDPGETQRIMRSPAPPAAALAPIVCCNVRVSPERLGELKDLVHSFSATLERIFGADAAEGLPLRLELAYGSSRASESKAEGN